MGLEDSGYVSWSLSPLWDWAPAALKQIILYLYYIFLVVILVFPENEL